jgi:hypothetical protein
MAFSCQLFILNRRLPTQKAQFTQHDVERIQRLSGKLLVAWVQPANSQEKAVVFIHPTIVKQAFSDSLSVP